MKYFHNNYINYYHFVINNIYKYVKEKKHKKNIMFKINCYNISNI